jgi:hypothetical protein
MNRKPQITVIGTSSPNRETYEAAYEVGKIIANMGAIAITGGRTGIMEAVAKGADDAGGISVGILPSASKEESNAFNTVVLPTGIGHARNAITVLAADIIVAIGGGAGTLSELAFGWIHKKPIFTLKGYGGWADEFGNFKIDDRREDYIQECKNLAELVYEMIKYCRERDLPVAEVAQFT